MNTEYVFEGQVNKKNRTEIKIKRQIARNSKHREHYNDIDQIKTAFEWESMLWAGDFHETINWRMSADHEFDIFVGNVMTFFLLA